MANIPPATQSSEGTQLTKPTDWSLYMVTAALKFSSDTSPPISYTTADTGRLDILKTLNWYEAHDEYTWPDFSGMGYDFSQAMRFRRALVSDVFVALEKAKHVRVTDEAGMLSTPQSVRSRGVRRGGTAAGGGRCMAERKRRCMRDDESDTDAASDVEEQSIWRDQEFLAETMSVLMHRTAIEIEDLERKKDTEVLASLVHDGLIEVWSGPKSPYGEASATVKSKADTWAKQKGSTAERSSP